MTGLAPPTCEKLILRQGHERPCGQQVAVRSWYDSAGTLHRACPAHVAGRLHRYPEADPPEPVYLHDTPDFRDHAPETTYATSEHGSLGLGSPWTRALFPRETREEVEALIPAGYRIDVTAYHGSPGPWNLRAVGPDTDADGRPVEVMAWPARHDPRTACRVMARELAELVAS